MATQEQFESLELRARAEFGIPYDRSQNMTDKPNHAQSIDDVMGQFQAGLSALSRRAAEIQSNTQRTFGKVNMVLDHAEHVNAYIEGKADSLSRFLGPPPNEINMPKQIEDAVVVEDTK